jgi:hypothetical protein
LSTDCAHVGVLLICCSLCLGLGVAAYQDLR